MLESQAFPVRFTLIHVPRHGGPMFDEDTVTLQGGF